MFSTAFDAELQFLEIQEQKFGLVDLLYFP
jgi:hypothetical protein